MELTSALSVGVLGVKVIFSDLSGECVVYSLSPLKVTVSCSFYYRDASLPLTLFKVVVAVSDLQSVTPARGSSQHFYRLLPHADGSVKNNCSVHTLRNFNHCFYRTDLIESC